MVAPFAARTSEETERAAEAGWHVVGRRHELTAPGAAVPSVLAPGALDEPILLLNDEQGKLRGFSNVCTHRGHLLLDAPRTGARTLQCPYHGRCFGLDGRVLRAPGFEGIPPDALEPLVPIPLKTWGPLIFAKLPEPTGTADGFESWLAGPLARLAFTNADRWTPAERTVYDVSAHWTVYIENYLEGLHIPYVHPGLAKVVDWRAYRTELQSQGNLQLALDRSGGPVFALPDDHPDAGQAVSAYYFWLFPTTMLNIYPWGLSLNTVWPQGSDRTRVVFEAFVGDSSLRGDGAGAGLDQVEREDEAVVTSVQAGIGSRLFRPGRLSPAHEACVDHFRRLLAQRTQQ